MSEDKAVLTIADYARIYEEIKGHEMPAQLREDILTCAPHLRAAEPQEDGAEE